MVVRGRSGVDPFLDRVFQQAPSTLSAISRRKIRSVDIADLLFAILAFGAVFVVHARWIYTHFSSDGYLLDSGWLAYLFGSADPLLRNPLAVNNLSFYAHHVSPHIFLFGAPLAHLFSLSGIRILAYHQGLFFGLFFVSLYVMVRSANLPWRHRAVGLLVAAVVGTLSNCPPSSRRIPAFRDRHDRGGLASASRLCRRASSAVHPVSDLAPLDSGRWGLLCDLCMYSVPCSGLQGTPQI